jgi:hypothetical protein
VRFKFTETSQIVENCNLDVGMRTDPDIATVRKTLYFLIGKKVV